MPNQPQSTPPGYPVQVQQSPQQLAQTANQSVPSSQMPVPNPLQNPINASPNINQPPAGGNKKWIIWVIIAVAVIISIIAISLGAYLFFFSKKSNSDAAVSQNSLVQTSPIQKQTTPPKPSTQSSPEPSPMLSTKPTQDLGGQLIFDLPPLVNKNQDQVLTLLGEPDSKETYWSYHKNGVALFIRFKEDKSFDYISVFFPYEAATNDMNKLTKLFNITLDSKIYKVTLLHELDDKSYITGFDIDSLQNNP